MKLRYVCLPFGWKEACVQTQTSPWAEGSAQLGRKACYALLELLIFTNMAACKEGKERKGNMFDSQSYNVAISVACSLLNVDTFCPEQKEAL